MRIFVLTGRSSNFEAKINGYREDGFEGLEGGFFLKIVAEVNPLGATGITHYQRVFCSGDEQEERDIIHELLCAAFASLRSRSALDQLHRQIPFMRQALIDALNEPVRIDNDVYWATRGGVYSWNGVSASERLTSDNLREAMQVLGSERVEQERADTAMRTRILNERIDEIINNVLPPVNINTENIPIRDSAYGVDRASEWVPWDEDSQQEANGPIVEEDYSEESYLGGV